MYFLIFSTRFECIFQSSPPVSSVVSGKLFLNLLLDHLNVFGLPLADQDAFTEAVLSILTVEKKWRDGVVPLHLTGVMMDTVRNTREQYSIGSQKVR